MDTDLQSIQEARHLVEHCHAAWKQFEEFSEDQVEGVLKAVAEAAAAQAVELARKAVAETGFGNVEDKTAKNLFASEAVYRAIRPLRTVGIVSEDKEKRIIEVASPVGVVAAIVPSTNPTSTAIYKALISLKGRNGIVFSPHPAAASCIAATVRLIAETAVSQGAPEGLISCMEIPTLEGTRALMSHPQVALILATGGPGLVRAAYSAGKPAFGVGAGNVPAYIERSAEVKKAVHDILTGKCFDNGTLCSSEQSIICDAVIRDDVLAELEGQGAYLCTGAEKERLEKVLQTPRGTLNTRIVGQAATRIAEMAEIQVPDGTRALVGFAEGVGRAHPLSMEKLSPVLGFYSVNGWRDGCVKCIEILNFGGLGHTLALHSQDEEVIRKFALEKPAFRICVNTPAALGAVGYTTNLFPAMTLGCGAPGGNITSDNISPLHLINLKRVAYGVRDYEPKPLNVDSRLTASQPSSNREQIASIVDGWIGRRATSVPTRPETQSGSSVTSETGSSSESVMADPSAPPLGRYSDLETPVPSLSEELSPAEFVCEDDVRQAIRTRGRIAVSSRTIITPLARDLGDREGIFLAVD